MEGRHSCARLTAPDLEHASVRRSGKLMSYEVGSDVLENTHFDRGQRTPAVAQGAATALPDVEGGEVHPEGWQPVPRSASPSVDWELLSPPSVTCWQYAQAGSTPDSREIRHKLPTVSTDENLAAAESAILSPLQSVTTDEDKNTSSHMHESAVMGAEDESGYASDSGSDRVVGLGGILPQGFSLQHQTQSDSDGQSDDNHSAPQWTRQPQLSPLLTGAGKQSGSHDTALSEAGGSFADLSAPASLQSFDFTANSAPGSPASYQAVHGMDAEEHGSWVDHQVGEAVEGDDEQASTSAAAAATSGGAAVSADADIASADDAISLQASISPSSSAILLDQEHFNPAEQDASDSDFTFPSDDDKQVSSDDDKQEPAVFPTPASAPANVDVTQPSSSAVAPAAGNSQGSAVDRELQDHDESAFLARKLATQDIEPPPGMYANLAGAANATCNFANGIWKWLQEFVGRLPRLVPAQARAAVAAVVGSLRRMDRSVMLGVGLAVVGALYAGTVVHNRRLSRALSAKDKDMTQLVMKVFNLQHTLQSSRSIPIVRHTSTTCSFSFAGGGVTGV